MRLATVRPGSPGARKTPRKRHLERRMYRGQLSNGVLLCDRGCDIVVLDRDGGELERKYDATKLLIRNIGDWLVAFAGDCFAALGVAAIESRGWREAWQVQHVGGDAIADGAVWVMPGGKAKP